MPTHLENEHQDRVVMDCEHRFTMNFAQGNSLLCEHLKTLSVGPAFSGKNCPMVKILRNNKNSDATKPVFFSWIRLFVVARSLDLCGGFDA